MRNEVEITLINLMVKIGMDCPANLDAIVDFVVQDILETRIKGEPDFTSEDVIIGFRRFIEQIG